MATRGLWGIICELSTWIQQNFIASTGVYITSSPIPIRQKICLVRRICGRRQAPAVCQVHGTARFP